MKTIRTCSPNIEAAMKLRKSAPDINPHVREQRIGLHTVSENFSLQMFLYLPSCVPENFVVICSIGIRVACRNVTFSCVRLKTSTSELHRATWSLVVFSAARSSRYQCLCCCEDLTFSVYVSCPCYTRDKDAAKISWTIQFEKKITNPKKTMTCQHYARLD